MAISDKEAALQIIDSLPDEATLEDIMYSMYVRRQIERGLRDEEAGNLMIMRSSSGTSTSGYGPLDSGSTSAVPGHR